MSEGSGHTLREIDGQPRLWRDTARMLSDVREELARVLDKAGVREDPGATIVLAGAGSSEFIGSAIAEALRVRLRRDVASIPTTHLVTHAASALPAGRPLLVVSFARSGDSPESTATYRLAKRIVPEARHLVITCNPDGRLAAEARADGKAFLLVLPPAANDQSLAMTGSFTSMALAGLSLAFLDDWDRFLHEAEMCAAAAEGLLGDHREEIRQIASRPFTRACFLGSGCLRGMMREARLKMLEMSAGRVAAINESFLGLRHGPQVFVDGSCAILASLSGDPLVRRYELDLLRELEAKRQGCGIVTLCAGEDGEAKALSIDSFAVNCGSGGTLSDDWRVLSDLVAYQLLAAFKSMSLGLSPDDPSPAGIISRVVSGVKIYET